MKKGGLKCTIEGWHQPHGAGYGWAPCSDKKAERFFVFHRGNRCGPRDFKTRAEAKQYVLTANCKICGGKGYIKTKVYADAKYYSTQPAAERVVCPQCRDEK